MNWSFVRLVLGLVMASGVYFIAKGVNGDVGWQVVLGGFCIGFAISTLDERRSGR